MKLKAFLPLIIAAAVFAAVVILLLRTPKQIVTPRTIPEGPITVTGQSVCLPHKNKDGPQTMECAFGIKAPDGMYYGLRDPDFKYVSTLRNGKTYTITGIFTKALPNNNYDTPGSIEIQSVRTRE
jgi:hypothetical protein